MDIMENKNKDAVKIDQVSFSYGQEQVLSDVSFVVERGDFVSLVGPNGGGKSTLLKLILGLLKPASGEIKVLGQSPGTARLKTGYMPQYAHIDMKFPVSVMDVVLMGRIGFSRTGRHLLKDRQIAEQSLEEVGLADLSKRPFNELSGGQRQRILIARALSCQPELLLLDEPLANIDPEAGETLSENLQQLNKRMTILLVSHDIGFVSKVVQSVICVNRCVVVHPTSDISGANIRDIYGEDLALIRHDHRCSERGHEHD